MFAFATAATLALVAVSSVNGIVIPRKNPPPGWNFALLENYQAYHTRYLALDCEAKHNTTFFAACCHPLLATQTLEKDRPAECIPNASASASAALAEPTSTVSTPADEDTGDCNDEDDEDEDDDDDECSAEETHSAAPAAHSSSAKAVPVNVAPTPPIITVPTTHAAAPTSKAAPPPSTPSSSKAPASTGSSGAQDFTGGIATFFFQNGVAGACGKVHSDSDFIAAIDQSRYGNPGEVSSLCGQQVVITNTKTQATVTVTIEDDCPTCKNGNSIDLSVGAFTQIGTQEEGEVDIVWHFKN